MEAIAKEVHQQAMQTQVPEKLSEKLGAMLASTPAMPWDAAIAELVRQDNK